MLRRDRAANTAKCAAVPPKAPTCAEAESQRGWRPDRRTDGPGAGGCNSADLAPWPRRTRGNASRRGPGEPETTPHSTAPAGTRHLVLQNGRPRGTSVADWTLSPSLKPLAVHSAIQVPSRRPKCSRSPTRARRLRPVRPALTESGATTYCRRRPGTANGGAARRGDCRGQGMGRVRCGSEGPYRGPTPPHDQQGKGTR